MPEVYKYELKTEKFGDCNPKIVYIITVIILQRCGNFQFLVEIFGCDSYNYLMVCTEEKKRASIRSKGSVKRKRLVSETSVKSGDKDVPEEEEDEDLPDVPFSRVLALNKPELPFILSKNLHPTVVVEFLTISYAWKIFKLNSHTFFHEAEHNY